MKRVVALLSCSLAGCTIIVDHFELRPLVDGALPDGGPMIDSGPQPDCTGLSAPANGAIDRTTAPFGESVTYSCDTLYYLAGNGASLTRTCQVDGVWSGGDPTCEPTGGYAMWPLPGTPTRTPDYDVRTDTVLDRVTGLEWQRTLDPDVLDWAAASAYCANLPLDGHDDWRLPSRLELVSIVDYTAVDPMIDLTVFPGTPNVYFWSASPSVNRADAAWMVDLRGAISDGDIAVTRRVRCVRGTVARAAPITRFTVNGDNTVTDNETGLVWQQQTSSEVFANAVSYCNGLGGAGWRPPHIRELQSIVDEESSNPTIDTSAFPGTASTSHWSSTMHAGIAGDGWMVDFTDAFVGPSGLTVPLPVRCVR